MQLIDPFDRKITYLRISITDHCNYLCFYCRDEDHKITTKREEVLSFEEITRIVQIFAKLGVSKIRLTGGEPLLRRNLTTLISMLKKIPNISDLPLSTNAHLLANYAEKLKISGVNRVNISLDSLDNKRFKKITRGGDLKAVIDGIDAAIKFNLQPIKLNMVVMKGVNDDEIEDLIDFVIDRKISLRFIETMPIGHAGIDAFDQHYPEKAILERLNAHLPNRLTAIQSSKTAGPARQFKVADTNTTLGVISAVSHNFCAGCNRLRLTSKGLLILCLGQENSISLRDAIRADLSDDEIKNLIIKAVTNKPEKHEFDSKINNIEHRQMVEIGG